MVKWDNEAITAFEHTVHPPSATGTNDASKRLLLELLADRVAVSTYWTYFYRGHVLLGYTCNHPQADRKHWHKIYIFERNL